MSEDIAETLRLNTESAFEQGKQSQIQIEQADYERIKNVVIGQQSKNKDINRKQKRVTIVLDDVKKTEALSPNDKEELMNQSYLRLSQGRF